MAHKYDILATKPDGVPTIEAFTNIYSTYEDSNVHRAFVKPFLDESIDQERVVGLVAQAFKHVTSSELTIALTEYDYRLIGQKKTFSCCVDYKQETLTNEKIEKLEQGLKEISTTDKYHFKFSVMNDCDSNRYTSVAIEVSTGEVFGPDIELAYRQSN